jgi:hypothetical protein
MKAIFLGSILFVFAVIVALCLNRVFNRPRIHHAARFPAVDNFLRGRFKFFYDMWDYICLRLPYSNPEKIFKKGRREKW